MKMSGRIVFDTGALVGAVLRPGSMAERAFSLALGEGVVCACEPTLERLHTTLSRRSFDRYMGRRARLDFVELLRRNAWICAISASDVAALQPSCRIRRDNVFLALAAAAEARLIVAGSPNLLARNPWHGIAIASPEEFLVLVERA